MGHFAIGSLLISFLRLFIMVTKIEQIFMSDHLHEFGTEVLCIQK